MSDSLWPHGLQHARPPCPSPTPRVYSNSCPLSWWCHPTISTSVTPFFSCPQSFPASTLLLKLSTWEMPIPPPCSCVIHLWACSAPHSWPDPVSSFCPQHSIPSMYRCLWAAPLGLGHFGEGNPESCTPNVIKKGSGWALNIHSPSSPCIPHPAGTATEGQSGLLSGEGQGCPWFSLQDSSWPRRPTLVMHAATIHPKSPTMGPSPLTGPLPPGSLPGYLFFLQHPGCPFKNINQVMSPPTFLKTPPHVPLRMKSHLLALIGSHGAARRKGMYFLWLSMGFAS